MSADEPVLSSAAREAEFATLRDLLAALDYESDSDDEVAGLIEEYADAYMDEDLGAHLYVQVAEGNDGEAMSLRAELSFYTEDAVEMWSLEAPFTVSRFHDYLDELDVRVARLRAVGQLRPVGPCQGDDEHHVPIASVLAALLGTEEAAVRAELGDDWVPIEGDVIGTNSVPTRYLLWKNCLVVGLDDQYVHVFAPIFEQGQVTVGDVLGSLYMEAGKPLGLAAFARALQEIEAAGSD